jgi:hypothetical protein
VTTDCLGHKEFLPNDSAIQSELTIRCTEKEPANDNIWFKNQGEWSKVEEESIRAKIKYCLDNQKDFAEPNKELSSYIAGNFTWSQAASRVKALLDGYTN